MVYSDSMKLDFSYDPTMWGPHTFPDGVHTDNAPELFAHFHNDLHMRFAGIRKPRTYRCAGEKWVGCLLLFSATPVEHPLSLSPSTLTQQ